MHCQIRLSFDFSDDFSCTCIKKVPYLHWKCQVELQHQQQCPGFSPGFWCMLNNSLEILPSQKGKYFPPRKEATTGQANCNLTAGEVQSPGLLAWRRLVMPNTASCVLLPCPRPNPNMPFLSTPHTHLDLAQLQQRETRMQGCEHFLYLYI